MRELPSGTVTLLFTDVEGSTKLLDRLGERYADVLAEHRRLLREAFVAHGGVEVDTQGDAFFVAFARPQDALAAAAQAQRALGAHAWPDAVVVRVRIGVHTGNPTRTEEGYVGLDVHRAARIMAAGHGGQVLVSETTAALVEGADGLPLLDLGEHPLKDMTQPLRLYQLAAEGLGSDFPALKTLGSRPNNLPVQPTALVGRERELDELRTLVRRARLVTLTGPGGTGKTRLALQLGAELIEHFSSGVFAVALAAIRDPGLVVPAIAQALKLREQPGEELADTLAGYLRAKELLLVLDNLEQVLEAAPAIASLLAAAPGLRVVATSREPLRLSGEQEYAVAPLPVADAIELFSERARAATQSFRGDEALVAEICRRLDNLPLAIELAAARAKLLPLRALLERLDERLKLLTGGARERDERQRTLRATIDWSHELLSDDEQALFRRLAIFAGGWTLDAAEALCAPEGELEVLEALASLMDKSLVRRRDHEGEPRFTMLETIREYARERLAEAGELEDMRSRHAEYFAAVAEQGEPELKGARQLEWLDRLELDHDNIRAALGHAVERGSPAALRLVGSLWRFWDDRGHATEGLGWARWALERANGSSLERARALVSAAWMESDVGSPRAAEPLLDEALARYDELDDAPGHAFALAMRGWLSHDLGDGPAALELAARALELARARGDDWTAAFALGVLAAASPERDADEELMAQSEALYMAAGDGNFARVCRSNRGWLALAAGRYAEAVETSLAAAADYRLVGESTALSSSLNNAAQAELFLGCADRALDHLEASLSILARSPAKRLVAEALRACAAVAALDGDAHRAGYLFATACDTLSGGELSPSEVESRIDETFIHPIRASEGEEFARGFEAGRRGDAQDAIAFALARGKVGAGR